ncbi:MAG: gluconate 5-dehydrogenase [Lachnospiraceae bacterium]|nr:gluconate 5-dehydrogenase [Lachnospiraceae bacterium]MEE1378467.1 gluconate 5-dehydrogenase [Oribacterium sp.]
MAGILDKFRLDGKVAWVTGASYGLGLAYAKAFAEAGAKKVVFNDINQELVDRGIAEYQKLGIDAYGVVCDVTNEEQVNALVKDVEEKFGGVDILVNNAGIIKRIPMVEMTKQQWDQVINVDLTGPFLCAKAVLPGMIKKGYGKIINACSMMSELGRETVSAYAAAKGGLKMLTKNICSEYGQYNIQCNAIGPGYIATPQTAPLRAKQADGSMAPFDRFIRSKTPAQRWGETEDLEGLAVFLASPASDFINGQVVYIDGGILAYIGQDPSQLDESKFQDVTGVEDIKVADH